MMEEIHKDAHVHGIDVHAGVGFIPWHRAMVNHFEELLREVDSRLSLHYWDWTTDPRVATGGGVALVGPTGFMGSASGNVGAPFQNFESTEITGDPAVGIPGDGIHDHIWRDVGAVAAKPSGEPDITPNANILSSSNFTNFHNSAKNAHDVTAHSYIGGSISRPHFSFHDPFVFLLHSNLDRLWATWQRAPGHPERLDTSINPSTGTAWAYGTILADNGLPSTYFDELVQPWAGDTHLEPWMSDPSEQILVSYRDPSIIIPVSYDTAVHTSYIVTDRNTFSSFELESALSYPQAFYVIYDGFTPNELGGAIPAISFHDGSISGAAITSIAGTRTNTVFENAAAVDMPQRISFTFEIHFSNNSAFTFAGEMRNLVLKAELGTHVAAASIHLINQPNPYMIDVQPGGSNPGWLSTDVRVFQLRPGMHLPGTNATLADPADRSDAIQYIQTLIGELRGMGNGPSAFDFISQNEQASQLELSRTVGGVRVFNFALAKVRYRANTTDATDVRVFFRGFNVMVSALDYTNPTAATGNYRRSAAGNIPLLGKIGGNIASIPYFAAARINSAAADMNSQLDDTNKWTINHIANQEAVAYYGCWLDFNQTEDQFPLHPAGDGPFTGRQSILALTRGVHQCLVAEVRFQPGVADPIPIGATPGSSDRLAQRNLAIVESDNPGSADSHVVQHTVTVKPSNVPKDRTPVFVNNVTFVSVGDQTYAYDELVIKWNRLPRDTKATLFFPEWDVDEVLLLASALRQRPPLLKKVDKNTLECIVTDISYIPVPSAAAEPYAGLITLELPQTVRDGEEFRIDVQQHSGIIVESPEQIIRKRTKNPRVYVASLRKVVGAFRITVAVKLGEELLRTAVRNLAVLRYIANTIPVKDKWHPVFKRYIKQVAAKVDALGYNSHIVTASPDDPGLKEPVKGQYYTGKIRQITYNCFGEFTGFTLDACSETHLFESCEKGIEQVVLKACRDRLTVKVFVGGKHIQKLVIKCC